MRVQLAAGACSSTRQRVRAGRYNAWWGLGNVYRRQEEPSRALFHFQKALAIHATNSVLLCHTGYAWLALNDHRKVPGTRDFSPRPLVAPRRRRSMRLIW